MAEEKIVAAEEAGEEKKAPAKKAAACLLYTSSSNPWSKRTWVRAPHKKAPRPQRGRLWRYDSCLLYTSLRHF